MSLSAGQTMSLSAGPPAQSDALASLHIPRVDVAALALLLDDAGTALSGDPIAASGLLTQAGGLVAEMLQLGQAPLRGAAEGGMPPWQVRRIRAHVEAHLHEPLPVSALSRIARLSCSYFSRAFKASFGCSPHAYVLERRIERAMSLMQASDEPLVQIAQACGFADQAHLSRIFRRRTGCTPSGWRRNIEPVAASSRRA